MQDLQNDNGGYMKKLIIIPAYNESESIEYTIEHIKKEAPDFDYVIINDCSSDNTVEILEKNHYNYISLPVNLGIGGAVQTGYKYALENGYDMAVQVDGDGQHDVSFLNLMVDKLVKEDADMVIGSRFINKEGFQSTFMRRVGITYFTRLIKLLTNQTITDPTSGFRLANRRAIELFAKEYPRDYPEPESVVVLLKKNFKIVEAPVIMKAREGGQSSIRMWSSVYYMVKVSMAILIEFVRK